MMYDAGAMLVRFLLFVCCFCCYLSWATAQTPITLTIVDTAGQELEGAAITTLPQQETFFTNALGQSKIPACDSLLISYLGLENLTVTWSVVKAQNAIITLTGLGLALPEIVVGSQRFRRDLSQERLQISALDIQRVQANTPAAALSTTAGAFVQMSQLGGGSPVLRGFEANRVLLVVDNIRMNNAIYRSGHLQNAITIDENALAKLEVSYGPGALAFGSDAIGGLIHFKTKNPLPLGQDRSQWSGGAALRYGTAAQEQVVSTDITYQSRNWSSYTAFTASRFGDLEAGNRRHTAYPTFGERPFYVERIAGEDLIRVNPNPDRQIGSGYDQIDLLQKLSWQVHPQLLLQFNGQYSTSSNIPRYDRLVETRNDQPRFAAWYYGPQERSLLALTANWQANRRWVDQIQLILSRQDIREDRFDRTFQSPWREENLVGVDLTALTIDILKQTGKLSALKYGGEIRTENVMASATRRSLDDDQIQFDVNSRYPSRGSGLDTYSAYIQYQRNSADSSLLWEGGLRWTQRELFAQFSATDPIAWPAAYLAGISNTTNALNAASGIRWQVNSWQFRTHLASGFRAPNIDDFAKFRENNGFLQIPNPALQAERSISADISIRYEANRNRFFQITLYRTWLRQAMIREDFLLPDGSQSFVSRGDTLFVQAVVNAEQARVWGVSTSFRQQLLTNWTLQGQLHYTYGRRDFKLDEVIDIEVPLDHIPPLYGQVSTAYRTNRWEVGLKWQFQARKQLKDYAVSGITLQGFNLVLDREGTSDNLDLTPIDPQSGAFTGSYGWSVWTINSAYRIGNALRLRVRVENLFDLHYRPFASGISAPGRNFVFGLYSWF
ncbi:MAG: TonB-dependent receptor [Bacteroidota bacterium]